MKNINMFKFAAAKRQPGYFGKVLQYVHHNGATCAAEASDGFIVISSTKEYRPELAGMLINRDGETVANKSDYYMCYPPVASIICQHNFKRAPFSWPELKSSVKVWKELKKANKRKIYAIKIGNDYIRPEHAALINTYLSGATVEANGRQNIRFTLPGVDCVVMAIYASPNYRLVTGCLYELAE